MSAEILETIKRQAESLTAQEKLSLGNYLLEQAQTTHAPLYEETSEDKRRRGAAWMKANREQYGGQYVALDGDLLIGVGNNYPEAARAAKAAGVSDAFVTFIYPHDYVGEMAVGRDAST